MAKRKTLTVTSIIALLMAMYMCWDLFEQIVMISIDDIMYSDWAKHGFQYFIDKNIWHYQNFNGRAFIHMMMQFVTFFDEHLYAILFPIMLGTITYLFTTIVKKDWELHKRLFAVALSTMLFLGLSHFYLSQVLWIAGGFNYVFPLFVISIFYFLYLKYRHNTKTIWWLLPFALLCGATTEQYGMYTIGLITMTIFFDFIEQKKVSWKDFVLLGSSVGGLLSVFLSPGTFTRFNNSNNKMASEGLSLIDGYLNNFNFIGGKYGLIALPAIFMLLIGLCAITNKEKYHKSLRLGIPFSILSYVTSLFGFYQISALLSLIFIVMLIIFMLIKKETRELGKIIVCGYGTFFMMSITLGAGNRTCIPCILSLIVVLSIILIDTFVTAKKKKLLIIVTAFVMIGCLNSYWAIYDGYQSKSAWCKDLYNQLESSSETGIIKVDFDETLVSSSPKFRYVTLIDCADNNQFKHYKVKFNIPDDVKINVISEKYNVSNVCIDTKYSLSPAIKQDGKIYIPLTLLYDEDVRVELKNIEDSYVIDVGNGIDKIICNSNDYLKIGFYLGDRFFVNIDTICEHYNLEYIYDTIENTYIFTKRN